MAKEDVKDLLQFIRPYPPAVQELALWLREWVWDLYPSCNELIYDNYNAVAFGWSITDKLGHTFCSVALMSTYVHFGFYWGSQIADPERRLLGKGNQYRYLTLKEKRDFPKTYIKQLLREAHANSLTKVRDRSEIVKGQTITKSISPKKRRPHKLLMIAFILLLSTTRLFSQSTDKIITHLADPQKEDIQFYWKDDSGRLCRNIQNLKAFLEHRHRRLLFAMNGGMFKADYSPVGLFIQEQHKITPLDTSSGSGNFYLKPNGVFYITTSHKAGICRTTDFVDNGDVRFATQSGPMLLIDGQIHPAFRKGSANLNIRNGVGLLPDNRLLFAISEVPINFYDFADFFKSQGCKNALYLDGFVSKMYLPEKQWEQTDGDLGVIIGASIPATDPGPH